MTIANRPTAHIQRSVPKAAGHEPQSHPTTSDQHREDVSSRVAAPFCAITSDDGR